ncbi:MAG: hypothetical protein QXV42_01415 [Ignisphaera sp.]
MLLVLNPLLIELSNANLAILSQYVRAKVYDKVVSETASKLFTVSMGITFTLFIIYEAAKSYIFSFLVKTLLDILE